MSTGNTGNTGSTDEDEEERSPETTASSANSPGQLETTPVVVTWRQPQGEPGGGGRGASTGLILSDVNVICYSRTLREEGEALISFQVAFSK